MTYPPSSPGSHSNGDQRNRTGVNIIGLLFGLLFLVVAIAGFTGEPWWLFTVGAKWCFAGLAAVFGIVLLLTALPGRRGGQQQTGRRQ